MEGYIVLGSVETVLDIFSTESEYYKLKASICKESISLKIVSLDWYSLARNRISCSPSKRHANQFVVVLL